MFWKATLECVDKYFELGIITYKISQDNWFLKQFGTNVEHIQTLSWNGSKVVKKL